jgi:TolB-like protein
MFGLNGRNGRRRKASGIRALLLLLLLFVAAPASGIQLAVMPLEDLSKGDNGLNPAMTDRLCEALGRKGFAVVEEKRIIDFMAKNRIRWVGRLDSQHVLRLRQELGIDYLLLGSVNQVREKEPAALGISLQIIRASDAKIVWAGGAQLCRADVRKFLGLAEPRNLTEIEDIVVGRVMEILPHELPEISEGSTGNLAEEIHLTPEVVKPGETMRCRVRFSESNMEQAGMAVSVVVDEKVIEAVYLAQEQCYEAAWPAAGKDGRYPVSVSVNRGQPDRKTIFAGSFLVDGQPPEIALSLRGQELDGEVVLRRQLMISPVLKEPEPIATWEISILDASGQIVKAENGRGNLPGRFSWWGQRQDGVMAEDGLYTVQVAVWDRAGNNAAVSANFLVLRKRPEINIVTEKHGDKVQVDLGYDGKVPLAFWRVELRSGSGTILQEASGEKLPARLMVPLSSESDKISCHIHGQDVLGNKVRQVVDNILALKSREDKTEDPADAKGMEENDWSVDF